jgi:death-on-curing protein
LRNTQSEALFPTVDHVEGFHETVIQQRGISGYVSKGMIEGCIEYARTAVYNFVPFPSLLTKAAALMYAFITFHPYADGNKRTALIAATFIFALNGYYFDIPEDSPDFAASVATRCLDSESHSPSEEITRIAEWMKPNVRLNRFYRIFYYLNRSRPRSFISEGLALVVEDLYFDVWKEKIAK